MSWEKGYTISARRLESLPSALFCFVTLLRYHTLAACTYPGMTTFSRLDRTYYTRHIHASKPQSLKTSLEKYQPSPSPPSQPPPQ